MHPEVSSPQQHARILILQARLAQPPAALSSPSVISSLLSAIDLIQSTLPSHAADRCAGLAEAAAAAAQAALLTAHTLTACPSAALPALPEAAEVNTWETVMRYSVQAVRLWEAALQEGSELASWTAWGHDLAWGRHMAAELSCMLALHEPDMQLAADVSQRMAAAAAALCSAAAEQPWTQSQHCSATAVLYPHTCHAEAGLDEGTCDSVQQALRAEAAACAKVARKGTPASLRRLWLHSQAAVEAVDQGEAPLTPVIEHSSRPAEMHEHYYQQECNKSNDSWHLKMLPWLK